jgi:tetratricopeptide (TPR) repeat protein
MALGLVVAAVGVYANSLATPFVFDDPVWIRPSRIGALWPLASLFGDTSRPLLNATLALNYALGGLEPFGYHVFNLVVHVLAGLTLAATVSRTLATPGLSGRFGAAAPRLGFAAALLFVLHPLQTQSVTYTIQRCESLMTLFYLLTLYCGLRGAGKGASSAWTLAAIASCAAGMATKEVMVTAPLVVLLHDRTFVSDSFVAALRARPLLYAGLAATLALLVTLFEPGASDGARAWAGFGLPTLSAAEYLRSQAGVVLHYLRLVVWPDPLVLDYAWPVATEPARYLPQVALVGALALGSLWAAWRHPAAGFLAVAFFVILAPTSSVMPIRDLAFEHRMYPALAPLSVAGVLGVWSAVARANLPRQVPVALLVVVCLPLAARTVARNADYADPLVLWTSVVEAAPHNARGRMNLGVAYSDLARHAEALAQFEEGLRLDPSTPDIHTNRGVSLFFLGRRDEAVASYRRALEIDPEHASAHANLGFALEQRGDVAGARRHLERATRLAPDHALAHNNLASLLLNQGAPAEALRHFRAALVANPSMPNALAGAAYVLASSQDPSLRDVPEAIRLAERAAELTGQGDATVLLTLAFTYEQAGLAERAARVRSRAERLNGL